jgi:hypothetical protein
VVKVGQEMADVAIPVDQPDHAGLQPGVADGAGLDGGLELL